MKLGASGEGHPKSTAHDGRLRGVWTLEPTGLQNRMRHWCLDLCPHKACQQSVLDIVALVHGSKMVDGCRLSSLVR